MKKINPQDDFYQYVNEKWLSENKIPEGYSRWGSFDILRKKSNDSLIAAVQKLASSNNLTKENEYVVNLYKNYLNDEARTKDGIKPIEPILKTIDQLSKKEDVTKLWIELYEKWNLSFFHNKGIEAYFNDSNVRSLVIGTMGLGMNTREFYEESHPRHAEIKQAYQKYINDLVKEANISFATKDLFNLVYQFEFELSQSMFKQEELRDPAKVYNEKTIVEINQAANFVDWQVYLSHFGYDKAAHIIVTQPKYLEKLNQLMDKISLSDLKDLMKYLTLDKKASLLTPNLYDIAFEYSSVFNGVKIKKPAVDRAILFVDSLLGEILSKEYIKENFSQEAKKDVLSIVHSLIDKYKVRIQKLDWMSEVTKQKAIEKLGTIDIKIGYPDKWEDFSDLEIKTYEQGGSLFANVLSITNHYVKKELADINKPVDRQKWQMFAQTVNAYYDPTTNEICFPAGILQTPFYDQKAPRAENLGGIGVVIGHEVSHGFDDQGSQYDKDGNFKNWWLPEDFEQYSLRTKKLVEEYNQFEVDGHHINGQLTLGENIGDLSGMGAALDIAKEETPNDLKLFFENYARVWCNLVTPQMANTLLMIDPHSPGHFRTNGIVVNIDEFHEIYQTKPGDAMYVPVEQRIKVW